jgi:hypothetical protein
MFRAARRWYVRSVPDGPAFDVIGSGRDPDRPSPGRGRLLAVVAVAVLIAGGIAVHLALGGPSRPRHHVARSSRSSVELAAPRIFQGTPLRPGIARRALLFLGGGELRLLNAGGQAPPSLTGVWSGFVPAGDPLGPDAAVQQVASVSGGVVALISSHGTAGLPDTGDVLFIPVGASRARAPRVIARANYMAVAPDQRSIWVEQAGPPWGNGPANSPAWLIDEAGHRLPGAVDLGARVLAAATVRGLLVQGPAGVLTMINPADGRVEPDSIPQNAILAGADAYQVAWQAASCPARCPLHVTNLRGGPGTEISLPADTAINPDDTTDFDPAGQRFALPLDTVDRHGLATGTDVYVADLSARKLIRVPGGPIPVSTLPAVLGAFPAGASDVVSARWAADGSGLWIVATDGLYFQVAYWAGTGPLHVVQPQAGLAYKFGIPRAGTPVP